MELRGGALPPLPALGTPQAKGMAGPTPFSNWVIPGQVIAGAYPASIYDAETERLLALLLELGVNTFVCLQAEVNIHIPEHSWRSGMGLRPYIKDAQKILSRANEGNSSSIKQRKIDFLHLPIIDGSVTTDSAMSRLADDCCERVLRGEKLYIHCWGGHGRTGTLVATMLGRLYQLACSSALRYTQAFHDTRMYPQGVRSPQTAVQRAQVRRLLLMPSSIPAAVSACTLAANINISSPVTTNTASAGSSPVWGPVAAARMAAVAEAGMSPSTPSKQAAAPTAFASDTAAAAAAAAGATQPFSSWPTANKPPAAMTPPIKTTFGGSSNATAASYAGLQANSLSKISPAVLGRNTVACSASARSSGRSAAGYANAAATAMAAAAAGAAGSRGACSASAADLGRNNVRSSITSRQQGLSGFAGAAVALRAGASVTASSRSGSATLSLLRASGPQTPVQQRLSSRTNLLRQSAAAPMDML